MLDAQIKIIHRSATGMFCMLRQVSLQETYMKTYSGMVYTYSETLVQLHLLKKIFL